MENVISNIRTNPWTAFFASLVIVGLTIGPVPANISFAAAGDIKTVTGSCGSPVNANSYPEGSIVYIDASNLDPNITYDWVIKDPGDNGTPHLSGQATPNGDGEFCIETGIPPVGGPYHAELSYEDDKGKEHKVSGDNFKIVSEDPTGTLIVEKIIVNNGSVSADEFSFTIDAGSAIDFESDGDNQFDDQATGDYVIAEVESGDFTTIYDEDCDDNGNITVTEDATVTCTITNTWSAPSPSPSPSPTPTPDPVANLTLVKLVAGGGDRAPGYWTLYATGDPDSISGKTGSGDVTDVDVTPGDYELSESEQAANYTAGDWDCSEDAELNGSTLTLEDGDDVTCTITNTWSAPSPSPTPTPTPDPGHLRIKKVVINDDGGLKSYDDFSYQVFKDGEDSPVMSGQFGSDDDNDDNTGSANLSLADGTYTVVEVDPQGYQVSYDNCEDFEVSEQNDSENPVVCTVTNDDDDVEVTPTPTPEPIPGCTDEEANNYDSEATVDDQSCSYGGGGGGGGGSSTSGSHIPTSTPEPEEEVVLGVSTETLPATGASARDIMNMASFMLMTVGGIGLVATDQRKRKVAKAGK